MAMPKALLIVAQDGYKDKEYLDVKAALIDNDVTVSTASKTKGPAKGVDGGTVDPDFALADVKLDDFDGIVFIGGAGAAKFFDDAEALDLAKQAAAAEKIIGAICIAPTILAKAGLLKGIRATSFASEKDVLEKAGAKFTGVNIETQGKIITADGAEAAEEFGEKIAFTLMSDSIE